MVVQKPITKIQLSQMSGADMDCVTHIECPSGHSGETQIKLTTGATATKPSQQQTPKSNAGKEKLTPKSVSTLPVVTPTKDIPSPIKHSLQMIQDFRIKHNYIEVLTVEGDEVLHLHTRDITANKCTVKLDKLSAIDIDNYNQELQQQ